MTHAFVVLLAVLGVVGQVLAVILLVIGALALVGVRGPLEWLRRCPLGLRALVRVRRHGDRDRGEPVLLGDRRLRAVRALLVPAHLHVSRSRS